jgi:hypothetical protein
LALLARGESGQAAEGGSSHYLPGVAGDIAIAQPPGPGLQVANTVWVQSGNVHKAVLQGQVEAPSSIAYRGPYVVISMGIDPETIN